MSSLNVYGPLRAGLFFYEIFRLLLLVVFLFIVSLEGGFSAENSFAMGSLHTMESAASGAFFPYLVYLSANALFPLMALFVWLRPGEYRNYLTLYIAGKIIGAVSFFAWEIFSYREFPGFGNMARSLILLGGCALINLADILSVGGAWMIKNKFRRVLARESGGV